MIIMIYQFLQEKFPTDWLEKFKEISKSFEILMLQIFSYSGFMSSLYYSFFSEKFRREHHSVILGRLKYEQRLKRNQKPRYLLRRNIHRLEKGLLMRPRKDVFGTLYINETVDAYKNCINSSRMDNGDFDEIQWAHDVLSSYFEVVGSNFGVDRAKRDFLNINENRLNSKNPSKVPFQRKIESSPPITIDDFLELAKQRKSVRWYLNKPVPREDIDKALLAATLSPSACNRQPYEFRVFDQPDSVQKIASLPRGTVGFRGNIPAIVVIIGKLDAFFDERDRHLIYIDASLAAMSFILSLETLGLSSCALNWPDIKETELKMRDELQLAPNERVIMLIAFGYPDPEGLVAYSQKKSLTEIRQYCST